MSILPFLEDFSRFRPSSLENVLQTVVSPRIFVRYPAGLHRNWVDQVQDTRSTVDFAKDKFQATIDVQQFKPDEISVKVTGDNTVIIEGKHEEKQDEHGSISRHFVRKYILPSDCDINQVQSKLSSDGILTIIAPKLEDKSAQHREIPIIQTGKPVKAAEQKIEEQKTKLKKEEQKKEEQKKEEQKNEP